MSLGRMQWMVLAVVVVLIGYAVNRPALPPDRQEAPGAGLKAQAAPDQSGKPMEDRVAEFLSRSRVQEPWSQGALEQHAALRRLYAEFQGFKDGAEFKRYGFGAGGPFGAWQDAVRRVNGDLEYAGLLFDRCGLTPDDLIRHASDGTRDGAGAKVKADAAAWAACFEG